MDSVETLVSLLPPLGSGVAVVVLAFFTAIDVQLNCISSVAFLLRTIVKLLVVTLEIK